MKKLILGTLVMFIASMLISQTADDYIEIMRSALKTEKKAIIAEVMQFTEAESEVFWPLYNEYNVELYKIGDKEVKIIKDFAKNMENLNDEKADELWNAFMANNTELLKLQKQYYVKFKKILPAGRVAKYFQAENKIDAIIDYELAAEIPFIETK
jgi:hypothetical protein